jgi:hypothetical protein
MPAPDPRWYHLLEDPKPPEFAHGPLVGTQRFLAKIICPVFGHAADPRAIHGLALDGDLWIVKSPRRQCCRAYFRDRMLYAAANASYLGHKNEQKEA